MRPPTTLKTMVSCSTSDQKQHTSPPKERDTQRRNGADPGRVLVGANSVLCKVQWAWWSVMYKQSSTRSSDATSTIERYLGTALLVSPQLSIPPAVFSRSSNCKFQFHLACSLRSSALMRPWRFHSTLPRSLHGDERLCLHAESWCRCRRDRAHCPPSSIGTAPFRLPSDTRVL